MLMYSRLPFKTKYHVLQKDATSIDSMLFCMFWTEPVPVTRLACMETLPERLNIGSNGLLLKAFPVCWMETILDAQPVCLSTSWLICAKISVVIPENWAMTKTCGMDCCFLTILVKNTPFHLGSGNARGSFINSASASSDLAVKPVKRMAPGRRPLKKLLPVNARPYHSTVVRGRSPFSTPQQFDANVGAQRSTTSRNLAFGPSQSGLFRSAQSENRSTRDSRSTHFQCSDFRRLYSLSAPNYSGQNLSDSGQCPMAQIQNTQRVFRGQSAAFGIYLSATLFSRTKSDRKSLADHSPQGNPQPLFPIDRRPSVGSSIPIHYLEAA